MTVYIPLNLQISMTMEVHGIEYVRHMNGREDICLTVKCEDGDELGFLLQFNLQDEILEVSE